MRLRHLVRRLAGAAHPGDAEVIGCREAANLIQVYLDGQTSVAERARVEQHLELCRRCGLEAHTYAEIKAALARRCGPVDELSMLRLRQFGAALVTSGPATKPNR
jgi:hypothetical protein